MAFFPKAFGPTLEPCSVGVRHSGFTFSTRSFIPEPTTSNGETSWVIHPCSGMLRPRVLESDPGSTGTQWREKDRTHDNIHAKYATGYNGCNCWRWPGSAPRWVLEDGHLTPVVHSYLESLLTLRMGPQRILGQLRAEEHNTISPGVVRSKWVIWNVVNIQHAKGSYSLQVGGFIFSGIARPMSRFSNRGYYLLINPNPSLLGRRWRPRWGGPSISFPNPLKVSHLMFVKLPFIWKEKSESKSRQVSHRWFCDRISWFWLSARCGHCPMARATGDSFAMGHK